ncbi:MAG: pilus assembly protein [Methylobacteriaceae bacterium]|nr:pilus assembly protein [Methylobacteriaceae bacterium]
MRARASFRGFARAEKGAAAVEFAIISIPLLALLLATFQTAVVLFAAQLLESATESAARQIMTGQAQTSNLTQAQFRNLICPTSSGGTTPANALPKLIDCTKLIIDVRVASNFSSADTSKNVFTTPSQAQFSPGGPDTINVVRVMYQLPSYLSIAGGGGSNIFGVTGGPTSNVILAAAVFQTEPYSP